MQQVCRNLVDLMDFVNSDQEFDFFPLRFDVELRSTYVVELTTI